jgi:phospholipid/cholesterol/gamma-HCH transport system permease protein
MNARHTVPTSAGIDFERHAGEALLLKLSGRWRLDADLPSLETFQKQLSAVGGINRVYFDTHELTGWDSGLLTFLAKLSAFCRKNRIALDLQGLPEGVRRLINLAAAVPAKEDTGRGTLPTTPLLYRVGDRALETVRAARDVLDFIGEASLASVKLLGGKARFRGSDLLMTVQETGAQALPIVSLISLLVGLILAFVGAVQLAMFGAQIYIANLVGIAMTREMGAMMAAIIMAGRTGAAFAAQLGTMQVNEEIDALKTLGVSPMEFLVLPRMLALVLMMPLLCLYADLLGMFGGALVSIGAFDLTLIQYATQTREAITLTHVAIGVAKSVVFGIVIALSGCLRGMQCGRSATEVGYAATSAVVTAIVWIIALDGLFAVMTNVLGI